MAYTVLARRYRSGTFDEVVGQGHVAQTLKRAIESERIAHAYLFCGTRGVGKTSMARILAKALNCQNSGKPTTEPCGKCTSCIAIARGDDMDVIEIDAASNTKVEETKNIVIDNVNYRPANSRFKIFIIDEVHMLSKHSFNALLKTLEEPPSHVKFILATTETEKIPNTILSRCQRYDFRNIPTREIAGHLKEVTQSENLKADGEALLLIAKAGAGSMRDALSLLDRLLSVGEKNLTVAMVEGLLGLPKSQLIFDLAQAIGEGDTNATLTKANAMINAGQSTDGLVASLVDHLRNLLILKTCGIDSELVEVPGLSPADLTSQAEHFDAVALSQDITILEELRRQMRSSGAGRALLDATLVRLALADQFASVAELLAQAGGGGGGPSQPRVARASATAPAGAQKKNDAVGRHQLRPQTVALSSPAVVREEGDAGVAPTEHAAAERVNAPLPRGGPPQPTISDDDDDLPRPGKVWENEGPSLSELLKQRARDDNEPSSPENAPSNNSDGSAVRSHTSSDSNVEPVDPENLDAVRLALLALLAKKSDSLPSLLQHAQYFGVEDGFAIIRYPKQHEFFIRMIERNGKKEVIREALSTLLQQNVGVAFGVASEGSLGESVDPSPKPVAKPQAANLRGAEAPTLGPPASSTSLRPTADQITALRESEPLIRALMDDLGAQVVKIE